MRHNPTVKEEFQEDVKVFLAVSCLYVVCAISGYQAATLASASCLVIILFNVAVGFHKISFQPTVDYVETDTLSQKQKEHGARLSRPNFQEDEDRVLTQLRVIERETQARNVLKNVTLSTTPSSTNLVDENPRVYFSNNHYLHGYMDSD